MKRYEKMTPDEIMKSLGEALSIGSYTTRKWYDDMCKETTPRIATINTVEDLKKSFKDFNNHCDGTRCSVCKYNTKGRGSGLEGCFLGFLEEEV